MPSKSNSKAKTSSKPKQQKSKSGSGKQSKQKKSSAKASTTEPVVTMESNTPTEVVNTSVSAPAVDNITHTVTESSAPVISTQEQINIDFNNISEKITALKSLQLQIVGDIKKLQKNVQKHIKESNKKKIMLNKS